MFLGGETRLLAGFFFIFIKTALLTCINQNMSAGPY